MSIKNYNFSAEIDRKNWFNDKMLFSNVSRLPLSLVKSSLSLSLFPSERLSMKAHSSPLRGGLGR